MSDAARIASLERQLGEAQGDAEHLKETHRQTIESMRATRDGIQRESMRLQTQCDALMEIIYWALGERDEFPERPQNWAALQYKPWYWWRKELRARFDAAIDAARKGPEKAA